MARDFPETITQWRELRTLCSHMERLINKHRSAYTDTEGNLVEPQPKTQVDIEAQIDALAPKINQTYNAMKAAFTP